MNETDDILIDFMQVIANLSTQLANEIANKAIVVAQVQSLRAENEALKEQVWTLESRYENNSRPTDESKG